MNDRGFDSPGPKYEINIGFLSQKTKSGAAVIRQPHSRLVKPYVTKKETIKEKTNRFDVSLLEKELVKER